MSPYTCFHLGPAKALICEYFPSLTPLDLILNYLYSDSITHSTDTADTGTGETSARVGLVSVSTTKDQVNTTIKGSVVDAKKFLCIQPSENMSATTKKNFPYNTTNLLEVLRAYKRSLEPTDTNSTAVSSNLIFH